MVIKLLKKVEGKKLDILSGDIMFLKTIEGLVQIEGYIELFGFIALTQDLTRVEKSIGYTIPQNVGLVNKTNRAALTIEMNY